MQSFALIRCTAPGRCKARRSTPAVATSATSHRVTLQTPYGSHDIACSPDVYILDAAHEAGIGEELKSKCKKGGCSACAGKILSGEVDQSDQSFLDADHLAEGFVLLCVAVPKSDVVILTDQEEEIH